jgi:hypothetical protein
MTRIDKIKLAISKGITYNKETGKVIGVNGCEIGSSTKKGYIIFSIKHNNKKIDIRAHHFGWYMIYKKDIEEQIDHINGIKNDNRICNLREVTHQKNQMNKNSTKGYSYNKLSRKFQAQIKLDNKSIYLGSFDTPEEARQAYLDAKKIYHII